MYQFNIDQSLNSKHILLILLRLPFIRFLPENSAMTQNKLFQFFSIFLMLLILLFPKIGQGKTVDTALNETWKKMDIGLAAIFAMGLLYVFIKIMRYYKRKRVEDSFGD